jgi:excisionase family DNA binding protein
MTTSARGNLAVDSLPDYDSQELRVMSEYGEWVTVGEAAGILGVHPETIRRMIRRNDLPAEMVIVDGRAQWRMRYADVINSTVNPPHRPSSSNQTDTN